LVLGEGLGIVPVKPVRENGNPSEKMETRQRKWKPVRENGNPSEKNKPVRET
jgi:hypothetical protein